MPKASPTSLTGFSQTQIPVRKLLALPSDRELFSEYIDEAKSYLSDLEIQVLSLEEEEQLGLDLLQSLFAILQKVRSGAGPLRLIEIESCLKECEALLYVLGRKRRPLTHSLAELLFRSFDLVKHQLDQVQEAIQSNAKGYSSSLEIEELKNLLRKTIIEAISSLHVPLRASEPPLELIQPSNRAAEKTFTEQRRYPDEFYKIEQRLENEKIALAERLGKKVQLHVQNSSSAVLSNAFFERISDPLLHLLRNAIIHGIEPVQIRRSRGKTETGQIHFKIQSSKTHVQIVVSDDGQGLDLTQIQQQAEKMGLSDFVKEGYLEELLMLAGFTSTDSNHPLRGKGIGLALVKQVVENLKGSLQLSNSSGKGFAVAIEIPLP